MSYGSQGGNYFFMKDFRPSSSPSVEFSNPGTCNIKTHNIFVPLVLRNTEKVLSKETSSTSTIQSGGAMSDEEIFRFPIKVSRTILSSLDKKVDKEENNEVKDKRKRSPTTSKTTTVAKKKKFSFHVKD